MRKMLATAVASLVIVATGVAVIAHEEVVAAPTAAETLARVLPYWQVEAPEWCAEDMICWIGSAADGRSAEEVLRSLPREIAEAQMTQEEADVIAETEQGLPA